MEINLTEEMLLKVVLLDYLMSIDFINPAHAVQLLGWDVPELAHVDATVRAIYCKSCNVSMDVILEEREKNMLLTYLEKIPEKPGIKWDITK